LAVILILQPGKALSWGSAVQDDAGRTAIMLDLDDSLFQPVGVLLLWLLFLLSVSIAFGIGLAGEGIDRVGVEV
jgi:hypothetical protein